MVNEFTFSSMRFHFPLTHVFITVLMIILLHSSAAADDDASKAEEMKVTASRREKLVTLEFELEKRAFVSVVFTARPGLPSHVIPVQVFDQGLIVITAEVSLGYDQAVVQAVSPMAVRKREFGGMGTTDTRFNGAQGLAVDVYGDLFVSDTGNDRIVKYTRGKHFAMRFGSFSWESEDDDDFFESTDNNSAAGKFNQPSRIASSHYLYVTDTGNDRVVKYDVTGNFVRRLRAAFEGGVDYDSPRGISIDQDGNVLVADSGNDRVCMVDADGALIRTFGSFGWARGQFNDPRDVVSFKNRGIWIADRGNSRVQKMDELGNVDPAWKPQLKLKSPVGLTVDDYGNIYVVDEDLGMAVCLTEYGDEIARVEGLRNPSDIAVNEDGEAFITEPFHHRIVVFAPSIKQGIVKFPGLESTSDY